MIKINNLQDVLKRLTYDCITTESEKFEGVGFILKDGQFAILTASNGCFTASAKVAKELFLEAIEIIDMYGDNRNIMVNQLQKDQGHSKQCVRSRQKKAG
jgi:hypothetical protein